MTLVEFLEQHAAEQPDATAYVFLGDDGNQNFLTYAQLLRRARAVASKLQESDASGARAILMYKPGLDFIEAILACFLARVVAVPVLPIRNARELPNLVRLIGDADSRLLLTNTTTEAAILKLYPDAASTGLTWLCTDTVPDGAAESFRRAVIEPSSLAFLQYTSGSTGQPKGVQVTHDNLIHNQRMIQAAFGHDRSSSGVGWLPLYHDMGLIGHVFQPLFVGFRSVLFSPTTFLMNPMKWLRAVSDWRATTSGGPSFAYELCVHRISPEDLQGVDLSCWKVAYNGAEPVKAHVINAFARKFESFGFREEAFYPCYGMAEATLFVTGGLHTARPVQLPVDPEQLAQHTIRKQEGSSTVLVGCGKTFGDLTARVVDSESLKVLPEGQIGEVWLSGASVAQGYWGQPEVTAAIFQARTADGEGPFLRTGDLGFWQDGELFITGRLKDLLIIRGRNHYPDDIEQTLYQSQELLRPGGAAAFTVDGDAESRLVLVAEVQRPALRQLNEATYQALLAKTRKDISDLHGLRLADLVLLRPATLPKTTSGKVRRSYCRKLYLSGGLERVDLQAAPAVDGGGVNPSQTPG